MRHIIILIILFKVSELIAQIKSNAYFDVIHSVEAFESRYFYFDGGFFGVNIVGDEKRTELMDTFGNAIVTPCDKILRAHQEAMYCYMDSLVAIYSPLEERLMTPKFDTIHMINSNFYAYRKNGYSLLNNFENKTLFKVKSDYPLDKVFQSCGESHVSVGKRGKRRYINVTGEVKSDYRCPTPVHFSDGSYLFYSDQKLGVKSRKGNVIISPMYDSIDEWGAKYIVGVNKPNRPQFSMDRLYGVIDNNGRLLLPLEYSEIRKNSLGLVVIKPNGKSVFLSKSLKDVYSEEFDVISAYGNGLIVFRRGAHLYYDLIYDGQKKISKNRIESYHALNDHISLLNFGDDHHVLVNREGVVIFESWEEHDFERLNSTLVIIKSEDKTGVINEHGSWVIEPKECIIKLMWRLWGFIVYDYSDKSKHLYNSRGEKIAENIETSFLLYPSYAYIMSKQNKVGVVDDRGKVLIPFEHQKIYQTFHMPRYYQIKEGNYVYLVKLKQ